MPNLKKLVKYNLYLRAIETLFFQSFHIFEFQFQMFHLALSHILEGAALLFCRFFKMFEAILRLLYNAGGLEEKGSSCEKSSPI